MQKDIEIWVDVPSCYGYQVSNIGNIRSIDRVVQDKNGWEKKIKGRTLHPTINKRGYFSANISMNGKRVGIEIHRLVAMGFLGHVPNGSIIVVDHIDKNPLNNRVENLRLVTQRDNINRTVRGKSKYPGVQWVSQIRKWRVMVRNGNTRTYVGSFSDEYSAYMAYLNKLNELGCTTIITLKSNNAFPTAN